jgi:nitrate/TMAO reductase-like tetraheme cytochrome c subunit
MTLGRRRPWHVGVGVIVCLPLLSLASVEITSTTAFCVSCHEMAPIEAAWQASEHFPTAARAGASCRDCHVPGWARPHAVDRFKVRAGLKDTWYHLFPRRDPADPGYYYALKDAVRAAAEDESCIRCHAEVLDPDTDIIEPKPVGGEAPTKVKGLHSSEEARRQRCVACHKHMGHGFYE